MLTRRLAVDRIRVPHHYGRHGRRYPRVTDEERILHNGCLFSDLAARCRATRTGRPVGAAVVRPQGPEQDG
ncbi:hypothetical protein ABZ801_01935 [Actinomadura sp. NPDC047616]|uniref:hypothetical protein n=1 Tax=Actinomadura sp. NPDC047616 TaxID=3155914 RepID=UPI0033E656F5